MSIPITHALSVLLPYLQERRQDYVVGDLPELIAMGLAVQRGERISLSHDTLLACLRERAVALQEMDDQGHPVPVEILPELMAAWLPQLEAHRA